MALTAVFLQCQERQRQNSRAIYRIKIFFTPRSLNTDFGPSSLQKFVEICTCILCTTFFRSFLGTILGF